MKVKVCPKCGRYNPTDAWFCADPTCGGTLAVDTLTELVEPLAPDVAKLLPGDAGQPKASHKPSGCFFIFCAVFIVALAAFLAFEGHIALTDGITYSRWGSLLGGMALLGITALIIAGTLWWLGSYVGFFKRYALQVRLAILGVYIGTLVVIIVTTPRSQLTPAFYQRISSACAGQGIAEAAEFTPGSTPHPTVLVDKTGNCFASCNGLESWGANSLSQVQLVLCVDATETTSTGRTCKYIEQGGTRTHVVDLKTRDYVGRLVAAKTGETIADFRIQGAPPLCDSTKIIPADQIGASAETGINLPGTYKVVRWLEDYFGK